MPECAKCGDSVSVPSGLDFDEDDLCYECLYKQSQAFRGILEGIAMDTCTCGTTLHRPCEVCRARKVIKEQDNTTP